jgi:hypothetical protein
MSRSHTYRVASLREVGQFFVRLAKQQETTPNPLHICYAERAEDLVRETESRCRAVGGTRAYDDPAYYGPTSNAVSFTLCPGVRESLAGGDG